jgi:hypothetical protein
MDVQAIYLNLQIYKKLPLQILKLDSTMEKAMMWYLLNLLKNLMIDLNKLLKIFLLKAINFCHIVLMFQNYKI